MKAVLFASLMALTGSASYAAEFQPAPWQKTTAEQLPKVFGKIKQASWSQDISLWLSVERDNTKWEIAAQPICAAMDGYGRPATAFVIISFLDAADLRRNEMTTLAKYTCPDAKALNAPQSANSGDPVQRLQLPDIIGKTQKEVDAILGKPTEKCSPGKYGLTCDYMGGATQIVYINKLADWISVEKPQITFATDALSAFGLTCTPGAAVNKGDFIRWDNTCPPVLSATIWAGAKRADGSRDVESIYIKAKTP